MKAAVYRRYGPPDVVHVEEVPTPEPEDDEILIRIRASTVASADWRMRSLRMPAGLGPFARPALGLFGPRQRILGTELAGVIEAVGPRVTKFKPGDAVFAFPGGFALGCHAEYRTLPEDGPVVPLPAGMGFEEAAALSFGGTTALQYLRDRGKVRAGEGVLIVGGSGAVGSAAVQIAKHFGACVTAVTSTRNVETVSALGADRVLDYTRSPVPPPGETYDIVFDTIGSVPLSAAKAALNDGGRLLLPAASLFQMVAALWISATSSRKAAVGPAAERLEDLRFLKELAEAGRYRPLIDRTYPLDRISEAHAHVETGHKRGSVVITMPFP